MTTTDYFIQESLVLDWVWERVKVDRIIDKNIQILDTIPKCWMAWAISAIWPFIFLLGKSVNMINILSFLIISSPGLLVQSCCTGRGTHHEESLPQVKYSKQDLNETKEERKQRKYRYLYQVGSLYLMDFIHS